MGSFNNREIASAIWLLAFLVFGLCKAEIRKSIVRLVECVLKPWLLAWICLMALYTAAVVVVLAKASLWHISLLKDTVVWFFLTGVTTSANCITARDGTNIFGKILGDSLKTMVLLEFLFNTYTFSLGVELIFVPLLVVLVMTDVIAKSKQELSAVAKLTGTLQALIGFAVLAYVISHAFSDVRSLGSFATIRSAILPPLLSILFSPFAYAAALEARYESLFVNLNFGEKKSSDLKRYAKRRIVMKCRLSLRSIEELHRRQGYNLMRANSRADIDRILQSENQHQPVSVQADVESTTL